MAKETFRTSVRESSAERLARELRGFGATGLFALGVVLLTGTILVQDVAIPVGALLVLLWVRLSHTPWREIGYVPPESWLKTILTGIVFGCAFKLITKSVIMPLLGAGPVNLAYRHLVGDTAMLPYAAWMMLVAGFAEETVFRGFLFERLGKLLGKTTRASLLSILITSIWFGLAHLPKQGFYGAVHGTLLGVVFGTIYAFKRRLIWLMIAHAAYDLLTLALIYWNLERAVSQFFFR